MNDGLRQRSEVGRPRPSWSDQDTSNVVSKVEKLLGEMDPAADRGQTDSRSQQLERVSSEYSRLKYYLSKGKGLKFLGNLEVSQTLDDKFFALLDSAGAAFENRHLPPSRGTNKTTLWGLPRPREFRAIVRPIVAQVLSSA